MVWRTLLAYKQYIPLGVLGICVMSIWYPILHISGSQQLHVTFLDVGQGDAIFMTMPTGEQVLIDGGDGTNILSELSAVMPFYDRSIDMIIVTHPDADHVAGLIDVVARFKIHAVLVSGVSHVTEVTDAFADTLIKTNTPMRTARRGDMYQFGDVTLEVLFPDRDVTAIESNTASVVTRISYGEHAFMLTGDAPVAIEEYLVSLDESALHATVLKAGHHGSDTSSSPLFIGYVSPEYVVYSRGCTNRYGHPNEEIEARFALFGVTSFDTCRDGRITFKTDGAVLHIKSSR